MIKIKRRSEQKKEDTWDLESIYPTKDEFNTDINLVKENTTKLEEYKGKILSSASNLLYVLDTSFDTERVIEKLFTYTYRRYDEDLTNDEANRQKGEITNLYTNYLEKTSFIVPELLQQDEKNHSKVLKGK